MRLPNIFDIITKDEVSPEFSPTLYDFNDPKRPLTTQEVKQMRFNQIILTFGLIEEPLDVERAEKTIDYIYALYPPLDASAVFDEEL